MYVCLCAGVTNRAVAEAARQGWPVLRLTAGAPSVPARLLRQVSAWQQRR